MEQFRKRVGEREGETEEENKKRKKEGRKERTGSASCTCGTPFNFSCIISTALLLTALSSFSFFSHSLSSKFTSPYKTALPCLGCLFPTHWRASQPWFVLWFLFFFSKIQSVCRLCGFEANVAEKTFWLCHYCSECQEVRTEWYLESLQASGVSEHARVQRCMHNDLQREWLCVINDELEILLW